MMRLKSLLFLVPAILFFGFTFVDGQFVSMKDVAGFRKGIEGMAKSTSTIKASFKQEKYMSILSNKLDSEGGISFKKPGLLKWQYNTPYQYAITLNGKSILINDQGKVKTFDIASSQAFKQMNELIINSVQGNVLDEKRFDIKYLESKEVYLAKLFPKDAQMKKFLAEINIYFNKNDYSVETIKLIEPEKDYTLINFYNKKLNSTISDEVFKAK